MKRFAVVGLGNFGSSVAETLHSIGHEVIALDADEERVDDVGDKVTRAAVGDGTDATTLERLGADEADAAVVSTGRDITASAMATLVLRDLGVDEIYVKVVSHNHARLIEKIGVTETIFPERESGLRLAKRICNRALLNYVELGKDFSVQEMAVPDRWVGRSLRELALPRRHRVSVVAVHDVLRDRMISIPDPEAALTESDTLLVAGSDRDLARVADVD